jgi:hypothetical protein
VAGDLYGERRLGAPVAPDNASIISMRGLLRVRRSWAGRASDWRTRPIANSHSRQTGDPHRGSAKKSATQELTRGRHVEPVRHLGAGPAEEALGLGAGEAVSHASYVGDGGPGEVVIASRCLRTGQVGRMLRVVLD